MHVFDFVPGYRHQIVIAGKEPLVLCLLALLITFALTRLYTRLARVRGWGSGSVAGGVHLHHMVIGILLILAAGFLAVAFWPGSPGREIVGIVFGIGAALTLDEFALWLYLRDVYWTPEGRSSVDAIVLGVVIGTLLLVGSSPFGVDTGSREPFAVAFAMVAVNVASAMVTFLKGKLSIGMLAVFVPLLGLISSVRLAKPTSPWARWFYGSNGTKLARAQRRFGEDAAFRRFRHRVEDAIGGTPVVSIIGDDA